MKYREGQQVQVVQPATGILLDMRGVVGTVAYYVPESHVVSVHFRNGWRLACFEHEVEPVQEPAPSPRMTQWDRLMEDDQHG